MTHVLVKPLRSYLDRGVMRKRGQGPYLTSARLAAQLESRGLCSIVDDSFEPPKQVAGVLPSASPADQASPQMTASESKHGGKRGRPPKKV